VVGSGNQFVQSRRAGSLATSSSIAWCLVCSCTAFDMTGNFGMRRNRVAPLPRRTDHPKADITASPLHDPSVQPSTFTTQRTSHVGVSFVTLIHWVSQSAISASPLYGLLVMVSYSILAGWCQIPKRLPYQPINLDPGYHVFCLSYELRAGTCACGSLVSFFVLSRISLIDLFSCGFFFSFFSKSGLCSSLMSCSSS
jgi:hypothetical protein